MPHTTPLFNRVAGRYDLLNTLFSLGMDRGWRRRLVEEVGSAGLGLDIATGTAEVAIEVASRWEGCYITGIDPSDKMLILAQKKLHALGTNRITLVDGFAEELPFRDSTFNTITIAFGIRNTVDPLKSLLEMTRVLKRGGRAGILEFAVPTNKFFGPFYMFYLRRMLPLIGSLFGKRREYEYLGDSTAEFPQRDSFTNLMKQAGFRVENVIELTLGTVILYVGVKE